MSKSRPILGGVVVLYFIIALEVLVMISPFAAFFYAVLRSSRCMRWGRGRGGGAFPTPMF